MTENEKIVLTLEKDEVDTAVAVAQSSADINDVKEEAVPAEMDTSSLSEEDKKMVEDFSKQINLTDTDIIMSYGSNSQKKVADFSSNALNNVKTKDLGEIGDMVTDLVTELKGFDVEEEKGLFSFLKKGANKLGSIKIKYEKAEVNVSKICDLLEGHQITLLKDIALLDELYARNEINKKELTMYIMAGKEKLKVAKEDELPKLIAIAQKSGLAEDSQKANDYAQLINRFEKKLHDLEMTRMVAIQMSPQIRLIQNNDTLMVEKIQSTLVNTIPLWKSQMVIALGLADSQNAINAEKAVDKMTNELLKKNADALKLGTIETAKASEESIVQIETLQYTNKSLIETMDSILQIQTEGSKKRRAAEVELRKLESELKQKLIQASENFKTESK